MAYRAVCDCGWSGQRQRRAADADHDRRVHEWVHKTVDAAPPLSADQIRKLRALFGIR